MKRFLLLFTAIFGSQIAAFAQGEGTAAPFVIRLQPFISSGVTSPVFMTNAGDGTNRVFIVGQTGIIYVVQPGARTPTTFLDITGPVLSGGERGLLGLAFHPQYETNRRFFVYYTRDGDGAIQISEFLANAANPNVADTTERLVLTIPHPGASNHNGGTIAFGPDGFLYAGPGDGGGANDGSNNAQNINSLLGKMIRINIDPPFTTPTSTPAYAIPPTNPYAGATAGADEIYAIGLRNPYRCAFDRGGTNELWCADVGQGAVEEVDIITLGANYGWRVYEGTSCNTAITGNCPTTLQQTPPLFQYTHTGGRCSVTGGFVYRGTLGSLPVGSYVYADYCSGEIFLWNNNQQTVIDSTSTQNIVGFGEDETGELYMIRENGPIFKIVRARASADVDGDARSDVGVFRPVNGTWYAINSSNGSVLQRAFGAGGDFITPGDVDGDNITDIGYFRPQTGTWSFFRSSNSTVASFQWGTTSDVPGQADYDGDARVDVAVFRQSTGVWHILRSSDQGVTYAFFGQPGDRPVSGDYDGDGRDDIAVFRDSNGTWYRRNSSNGAFVTTQWGLSGDQASQGDFDGDGRLDHAVFRPSTGVWYILFATGTFQGLQWGAANDLPAVGDYDGDARDDIAVFRPSNGNWYIIRSSGGFLGLQWGVSGDLPIPTTDGP